MITDKELKDLIVRNPDSIVAAAYRLGRKQANLELAKSIQASMPNCLREIWGSMKDTPGIDEMIKQQQEAD